MCLGSFFSTNVNVLAVATFRLKELAEKDAFKLARETAMNKLESYIYDKRDKLYQVKDGTLVLDCSSLHQ